MVATVFRDEGHLQARFVAGLERMLGYPELGPFILVLANATYDGDVYGALAGRLRERFADLARRVRATLAEGGAPADAPDDVAVFLRLMAVGFDALPLTQFRREGPWEVQFNLLRAFRPARMGGTPVTALRRPFEVNGFHFDKPFLEREILWQGDLLGRPARLLYNKFPFARLHGLLVVEPERHCPQFLEEDEHLYVWRACESLGRHLPGIGFGYNSLGAFASVNHQHFQSYVRAAGGYPIENPRWRHNGGAESYPLDCSCFRSPGEAWQGVTDLHRRGVAYNLLYRPGGMFLVPRAFQGDCPPAAWSSGLAWSEVAGAFTTFNRGDYGRLDDATLRAELARIRA